MEVSTPELWLLKSSGRPSWDKRTRRKLRRGSAFFQSKPAGKESGKRWKWWRISELTEIPGCVRSVRQGHRSPGYAASRSFYQDQDSGLREAWQVHADSSDVGEAAAADYKRGDTIRVIGFVKGTKKADVWRDYVVVLEDCTLPPVEKKPKSK